MAIDFKGRWFEREFILQCVRWYVAYPLSYRQLEEIAPELEEEFRKRKASVGSSWRCDETYVKVKGQWKYLYRAVDKEGATGWAPPSTFCLRQSEM